MRKNILGLVALGVFVLSMAVVSSCSPTVSLMNQDPFPANPGETVDVVFQIMGVESSSCGMIYFEVVENFPFSVDESVEAKREIRGGGFLTDYENYWLVPYKLVVSENAKDGEGKLDVLVSQPTTEGEIKKSFDIEIKDVTTDFEVSVKNYDPATKRITFEILNSGKNDVEALSMELRSQDNVVLRGTSTNIIGSLDSNDFTTADFEASAEEGDISLTIHYTDTTDTRRNVTEIVSFDPAPFLLKSKANGGSSTTRYVFWVVVIGGVAYYFYRRSKKKKERHHKLLHHEGHKK